MMRASYTLNFCTNAFKFKTPRVFLLHYTEDLQYSNAHLNTLELSIYMFVITPHKIYYHH